MTNPNRLPTVSVGTDLDREVTNYLQLIDSLIQPYLNKAVSLIPECQILQDGVAYQIRSGGKRIRAALCTTACEVFCGSYQPAISFATVIELVHNFTLIHDDIIDGDTERRGMASVWKRFGLAHSINIADMFASLSALSILESDYEPQTKLSLMQMVAEFGLEVVVGQGLDIALNESDTPSVAEYLLCTRKKTGALLAMATVGGAMIGGASQSMLPSIKEATMLAGMAFQIKDDLLDLTQGKGRPVGSDTLAGKRTLLVVYTLQHADDEQKQHLLTILNKPRQAKSQAEIQWVSDLYERIGAIEYARLACEHLIEQATTHLMILPESAAKERLCRMTSYLVTRVR